jgi:hypothetical protein
MLHFVVPVRDTPARRGARKPLEQLAAGLLSTGIPQPKNKTAAKD